MRAPPALLGCWSPILRYTRGARWSLLTCGETPHAVLRSGQSSFPSIGESIRYYLSFPPVRPYTIFHEYMPRTAIGKVSSKLAGNPHWLQTNANVVHHRLRTRVVD